MNSSHSLIVIPCSGNCGAFDKVPAYEDRGELNPDKRIKPVQSYPYICLDCWRDGWRHDGPIDSNGTYRIYHLLGKPLPAPPSPP